MDEAAEAFLLAAAAAAVLRFDSHTLIEWRRSRGLPLPLLPVLPLRPLLPVEPTLTWVVRSRTTRREEKSCFAMIWS